MEIQRRAAAGKGLEIEDAAARRLARAARDTPREVLALLRPACQEALVAQRTCVDHTIARRVLERSGIGVWASPPEAYGVSTSPT